MPNPDRNLFETGAYPEKDLDQNILEKPDPDPDIIGSEIHNPAKQMEGLVVFSAHARQF